MYTTSNVLIDNELKRSFVLKKCCLELKVPTKFKSKI